LHICVCGYKMSQRPLVGGECPRLKAGLAGRSDVLEMVKDELGTDRRGYGRFVSDGATIAYRVKGLLARVLGGRSEASLPVRNVSARGVCFMCSGKLKSGWKLEMEVRLHRENVNFSVGGEVVWVGRGDAQYPHRAGVKFTAMMMEAANALNAIADKLAAEQAS